ncbi:hypothetical protein M513_08968 [Trichuris suis]|uniref:Protein artemis n=1 Tax=Trichuris suis TaxID=68888 RepID=A0A085LYT3_9BILA|nr:hypothetical protein M513_08968 [Trichuris suis]
MSCFNGVIVEYNFISVDYFCDRALQACMRLFSIPFPFRNPWKPTCHSWFVVPMITVPNPLLPGGHCFGSVMFLFEGSEGPVLYTGDERVNLFDWKGFPVLHIDGELKQLTSLYFDSTFCTPHTRRFPSRREAAKAASKVAADWLNKNSENRILLKCPYQYGYEFLFCQLSRRLKQKIHVNEGLLRAYEAVEDISNCLTDSCDETRLHAFVSLERGRDDVEKHKSCKVVFPYARDSNTVLTLKPSVMWFAVRKNTKCVQYSTSRTVCHILYSNHSSLDEVVDMVSYLKPKTLYPCVLPNNCSASDFQNFLISSPLGQFQLKLSGCLRPAAMHQHVHTAKDSSRQCSRRKTTASKRASYLFHIGRKSLAASYVISPSSETCEDGSSAAASSFK